MSYGVTDSGFIIRPLDVLIAEATASSITLFGSNIDVSDSSPLGKINQTVCAELSIYWEKMNAVYLSAFLDSATGENLDKIVEPLGVTRKPAVRSTGVVTFTGTEGTTISGQTIVKTDAAIPIEFKTNVAAVLSDDVVNGDFSTSTIGWTAENDANIMTVTGGASGYCLLITYDGTNNPYAKQIIAVEEKHFYEFSVLVKEGTSPDYNVNIYDESNSAYIYESGDLTETAGDWSEEVSTQIETPEDCTSISIHLIHRATGASGDTTMHFDTCKLVHISSSVTAVDTGTDGNVAANTITSLSSPISGITAVTNQNATSGGSVVETDVGLRIRTKLSFGAGGKATLNAIVAQVLAVDGVSSATIEENDTDTDNTGSGGLPPHSVRVSVSGGTDTNVAQALLDAVAAGIRTYGSDSGTGTIDNGQTFDRYFARPVEKLVYVSAAITSDDTYTGDESVETAIISYLGGVDANDVSHIGIGAGDDVIFYEVISAIMDVPGVTNATVWIGLLSPPSGTLDITISSTEVAYASTTSVVIT